MRYFARALRFAWPYRARFAVSVACALAVAALWSGNFGAVFPVLKIVFDNQSLQGWIDGEVEDHAAKLARLQSEASERFGQFDSTSGSPSPEEQAAASNRRREIDIETASLESKLQWSRRASDLIHRYAPQGRGRTLVAVMLLVIAALALKGVFGYFNESLVGQVSQLAMLDLKNRLYRHHMRMDLATFHREGTSSLMARFTNDLEILATGVETVLGKVIREPLKAAACLVLACWMNWRLSLVVLAVVPVAVLLIVAIGRAMKRASKRYLESMSSVYRVLQESFQGIKVVKAFTAESHERRRFFDAARSYYRKTMRIVRLDAITGPATEMVGVVAITAAVLIGAFLVIGDDEYSQTHVFGIRMADAPMSPASLLLVYTFLAGISDPVRKLSNVFGRMQRAEAAAERVFRALDERPSITDRPDARRLPRHRESIEFREIEFSYAGYGATPVLKGVSLRVNFGETIAIVGPNGCGKSTLLSLLPRFYDPARGAILIDGIDIRDIHMRRLRQQIGIVSQETVLFDDTVLNNIRYGRRSATRAEIEAAAKRAFAHRFIEELPQGYDTIVGEAAVKLSGGQRQRIALARAILRDPAILILDEATSALDLESESLIQRALSEFVRDRTTFLITHRLGALELADRIVVMNEGVIQDVDRHDELLRRCPLYARLHETQARVA